MPLVVGVVVDGAQVGFAEGAGIQLPVHEHGLGVEGVVHHEDGDGVIVYHCSKNVPYFDSMGASTAMLPLSQAQVDELGVEGLRAQDTGSTPPRP